MSDRFGQHHVRTSARPFFIPSELITGIFERTISRAEINVSVDDEWKWLLGLPFTDLDVYY